MGGFLCISRPEGINASHYANLDEVFALVAYLASTQGKFITGHSINVDNGIVKKLI